MPAIGAGSFCALQVIPEGMFVVLKAMVSNAQLSGVRGMVESVLESGRFLIGMEIGSSIAVHLDNLQPIEWPGDTWVCRGCKNKSVLVGVPSRWVDWRQRKVDVPLLLAVACADLRRHRLRSRVERRRGESSIVRETKPY